MKVGKPVLTMAPFTGEVKENEVGAAVSEDMVKV